MEQAIAAHPLRARAAALAAGGARRALPCRRWRSPRGGGRRARSWRAVAFAVLLLLARRPAAGRGDPADAARYRPAGGRPDRVDGGRRRAPSRRAGRARSDRGARRTTCTISNCARITVPELRRRKAPGCSPRSTGRWPTSRAPASPAIIAITDGQVHDIPAAAPGGAPLHVLIPAKGEETDRRIRVIEAPEYGIVGKSVHAARRDRRSRRQRGLLSGAPGAARLTIRRDGEPPRSESVPIGREHIIEVPITRAGPTVVELSVETLPGEVSTANNTRGGRDQRRARPAARAAGFRRAASGRAHLAAAAESRPGGRSGAFHHPAPAGEGRPDAAQRAGADRLPGARAVPG